jgi:hypothetical protein
VHRADGDVAMIGRVGRVLDPASRDVRYLITESRSAASPLIAGLTDAAMRAGRRHAKRSGGRLDPPMVLVLDEAANICRIADLPTFTPTSAAGA